MQTSQMNDEALNIALLRVADKLKNHRVQLDIFRKVRDDIDLVVQSCADNVTVRICIDVLNDPIKITAGKGQNLLEIQIKGTGDIVFSWEEETWGKRFNDVRNKVTDFTKTIVSTITSGLSQAVSIGQVALKAIQM